MLSVPNDHIILYLYGSSELNFMYVYVIWDIDLSVLVFYFHGRKVVGKHRELKENHACSVLRC